MNKFATTKHGKKCHILFNEERAYCGLSVYEELGDKTYPCQPECFDMCHRCVTHRSVVIIDNEAVSGALIACSILLGGIKP